MWDVRGECEAGSGERGGGYGVGVGGGAGYGGREVGYGSEGEEVGEGVWGEWDEGWKNMKTHVGAERWAEDEGCRVVGDDVQRSAFWAGRGCLSVICRATQVDISCRETRQPLGYELIVTHMSIDALAHWDESHS